MNALLPQNKLQCPCFLFSRIHYWLPSFCDINSLFVLGHTHFSFPWQMVFEDCLAVTVQVVLSGDQIINCLSLTMVSCVSTDSWSLRFGPFVARCCEWICAGVSQTAFVFFCCHSVSHPGSLPSPSSCMWCQSPPQSSRDVNNAMNSLYVWIHFIQCAVLRGKLNHGTYSPWCSFSSTPSISENLPL